MSRKLFMISAVLILVSQFLSGSFSPPDNVKAQEQPPAQVSSLLKLQVNAKIRAINTGEAAITPQESFFEEEALFEEETLRYDRFDTPQTQVIDLENLNSQQIFIHFEEKPSPDRITELENMGLTVYPDSWIPPLPNHPTGYLIADMPLDKLDELAGVNYIRRLETAERRLAPQNDLGTQEINADDVWGSGYDGTGVTIAVLDSGLDMTHNDFPTLTAYKDYSAYPALDNNIANTVTGHGTHVAGSVLGRGTQSGGVYKGSAPDANLVFLKIGSDASGSASTAAMTNAVRDAIDVYHADIITMSYGGWDSYHDGSSEESQAVDYAVSRGATVFISAGNSGNDYQHYSGTVAAGSSTDYIQVNINTGDYDTGMVLNMVWYDGTGTSNDLSVQFYGNTSGGTIQTYNYTQTESSRGTESRVCHVGDSGGPWGFAAGYWACYLKVSNSSGVPQDFHLYVIPYGVGDVFFPSPDPLYTLGSPADADSAIAVGSYSTRQYWWSYNNSGGWYQYDPVDTISSYSSRGPRVDTGAPPKVSITAPGSGIISCRDNDVYPWSSRNLFYIDNDGPNANNPTANDGAGPADYYMMHGTSMACPIAAGAGALLLDKYPDLTPAQVRHLLEATGVEKGAAGHDSVYGWGLLDIQAATGAALPACTSYGDGAYTTPDDSFTPGNTVYNQSTGLHPSHGYQVAYYDGTGSRVTTANTSSDSSGNLPGQYTFTGTEEAGTWYTVVCERWFAPPATYNSTWPYMITADNFTYGAAVSPSVTTGNATDVTSGNATLNGWLDSLGTYDSANVSFEWGLAPGALSNNTTRLPMDSESIGGFDADLTGLSSGTTYYFRAKAECNPTVYGETLNFTTMKIPPAVATLPAGNLTHNSANLTGNLTALNDYTSANVSFMWGTDSGNLTNETTPQAMGASGLFNYGISGLTPETTYYFRAKAAAGSVTVYGGELDFTTSVAPFGVTTLTASNLTMTSAIINGNLDSLGIYGSANVSFQWGNASDNLTTNTTAQLMMAGGTFNAGISGLTANVTYFFRAKAVSVGETVYGGTLNFTTLSPLTFVSLTPSANSMSGPKTTDIEITFSSAVDGSTVSSATVNVHGSMSGRIAGSYTTTDNIVTLNPDSDLKVGETVTVSLTSGIVGIGSGNLSNPTVLQFIVNVPSGYKRFIDSGQAPGITKWSEGVALGDVDGDGDLDAVVANVAETGGGTNEVLLNNGDGSFTDSGQNLGKYSYNVALGDLDNDGDLDVFIAHHDSKPCKVWLNDGSGVFSNTGQSLDAGNSTGISLGDIDNDGDLDAFITNFNNVPNRVFFNNGSGNFTDSGQLLGTASSQHVELGDLDGDGDLDAFVVNNGANKIYVNNGSGNFTVGGSLGTDDNSYVALGDVDGDGDLDAFVTEPFWGESQVWTNDGDGGFTNSGQMLASANKTNCVQLGDLDGDGDLDAFITNGTGTGEPNRILLNDGIGNFTDSGETLGMSRSYGVALGDLDGDNDLDAFVTNSWGLPNAVYLNEPLAVAETGIEEALNGESIAVVTVIINKTKNPTDNTTVNLTGGLGGYQAQVTVDSDIVVLGVNGIEPFEAASFNGTTGVFSAENLTAGLQAANTTVAELVVRLTGNATTTCNLTVTFLSITAAGSPGINIPEESPKIITFQRGDTTGDGEFSVYDVLYFAQFQVGTKSIDEIRLVNGASVNPGNDVGVVGDKPDVYDVLYNAQYQVGTKNSYFE